MFADFAPLELGIVGKVLMQAALVGVGAGLVGAALFASSSMPSAEYSKNWLATCRFARTEKHYLEGAVREDRVQLPRPSARPPRVVET